MAYPLQPRAIIKTARERDLEAEVARLIQINKTQAAQITELKRSTDLFYRKLGDWQSSVETVKQSLENITVELAGVSSLVP